MSPLTRNRMVLILALLALAACGKSRNPVQFDPDTGHPGDWLAKHGAAFSSRPTQCRQCHGDGLSGGVAAISCYMGARGTQGCHPGGPGSEAHGAGWTSLHPSAYRANPGSCTSCHGGDLGGGSSGVGCSSGSWNGVPCHTGGPGSFTHDPGWIGSHPGAYRNDPGNCASCHGGDLRGGSSSVSCYLGTWNGLSCHAGGPGTRTAHPSGWMTAHPSAYRSDPAFCAACHGATLRGGTSGVSCYAATWNGFACHAGGPGAAAHPPGWITGHRSAYASSPESCAPCHGADLRGGTSHVSCYSASWNGLSCHAGGPGASVHPSGWINLHPSSYRSNPSSCTACHGSDLRGGSVGVSCYSASRNGVPCHAGGPGVGDHPAGWVISAHVPAAQANVGGCMACHGADLGGGSAGVACTSCHMESWQRVHPLGWYPNVRGAHDSYAESRGTGACANPWCHGTGLRGVAGSGPSCTSCHDL